jgi:heparosan-N-sulfate-glucuronate 5-epimerase
VANDEIQSVESAILRDRRHFHLVNQRISRHNRWNYYRRIFSAYLGTGPSQLTFWHETPQVNLNFRPGELGEYYMTFTDKANYPGPFDHAGIPMLDYRGVLGRQYNPIAIAQYGLGNYNLYARTGDPGRKDRFLKMADWLQSTLVPNYAGLGVWMHNFDFEYRDTLRAPWYSGLAQGQGISLLLRAHKETGAPEYLSCATRALETFFVDMKDGGVACHDDGQNLWFEEYIVFPPTHILNGFLWAIWGIYDYFVASGEIRVKELFAGAVETLRNALPRYDTGSWSLYEQSGTKLPMIASPFYHALHIVQLRVMRRLTGEAVFSETADRWESYAASWWKRKRALAHKIVFKLCYY